MIEEWKVIEGFSNYLISNLGNVKSLHFNKLLKQFNHRDGYKNVYIYLNNKKFTKLVHRLVGLNFINNPDSYKEINHIDGNKKNNTIYNLEWSTRSLNIKHAFKMKLKLPKLGEENNKHKLKECDIIEIRQLRLNGETLTKIAEKYNVSAANIDYIVRYKTWKHI